MVSFVQNLILLEYVVKIHTLRLDDGFHDINKITNLIEDWCESNLGKKLEIVNIKDHNMIALYDDKAFSAKFNV